MHWEVVGRLSIGTTLDPLTLPQFSNPPKLGNPKLPPSNYDHTAADGATLWIDRRCEVIVIGNVAAKIFNGLAFKFAGKKNCEHVGGLSPTICGRVLFSISPEMKDTTNATADMDLGLYL